MEFEFMTTTHVHSIVFFSVPDGVWDEEDLFTFIHITDLHISKYKYLDIKDDLQEFFTTTLDTIKPKVVIASGDLTDAKDSDGVGSFQLREEWNTYKSLLLKNNVLNKTVYLDIRGNHDTFDVHSLNDSNNYFASHSSQVICSSPVKICSCQFTTYFSKNLIAPP